MHYSVYDSSAYVKELESRNGLFKALCIIGASRVDEVLSCESTEDRYHLLMKRYHAGKESFGLYNMGFKYIYAVLRERGISIRKSKCKRFAYTKVGQKFYTDVSITEFAKALLQTINADKAILMLFIEVLSTECDDYSNNIGNPVLADCVQHLFGFQYECLYRIVRNRAHPNSRKSVALRKCLCDMDAALSAAGYPKCR